MKAYYDELKNFIKNKAFIIAVFIVSILSYGFAATNITISIDDLEGDRYVGSGNVMIYAGRFGTFLWNKLQGNWTNAFSIDCISVLLFIFAAINLCVLFRRITANRISMAACTVFACALISYPLINEVWEYTGTNVLICGGMLLSSFIILFIHHILHADIKPWKYLIGSTLLMAWVCSSYESIVPVYIFFVFVVLALQIIYGPKKEKHLKEIIRQSLHYAAILCAGILLRSLVHYFILLITGTQTAVGGATDIYWGTEPLLDTVKLWIIGTVRTVMHSIIYFPLTELLIAMIALIIIGIVACKKHGAVLLLPGFGMFFSLIILSLIQGRVSPYRTCQVYGAFVAFVLMILVMLAEKIHWKKEYMRPIPLILAAFLCFHQAVYLNYFLTLNHIRSEEEAYVIREVGTDLQKGYDLDKQVVFVGIYQLSDYIQEQASISENDPRWHLYRALWCKGKELIGYEIDDSYLSRKLPQTNVNSVLRWAWYAYDQQAMQHLFSYYGVSYPNPTKDANVITEATQYAREHQIPQYPLDGYICETQDYVIVRIGPL